MKISKNAAPAQQLAALKRRLTALFHTPVHTPDVQNAADALSIDTNADPNATDTNSPLHQALAAVQTELAALRAELDACQNALDAANTRETEVLNLLDEYTVGPALPVPTPAPVQPLSMAVEMRRIAHATTSTTSTNSNYTTQPNG